MKDFKVIGIGFHKTGTKTLEYLFIHFGYKVIGPRIELADKLFNGDLEAIFELADQFDAFEDNPWPILYKEMDKRYPNSKFILTIRDEKRWIRSVVNHFGKQPTKMRQWIYGIGYPKGNEALYLNRYRKHNTDVINYFKGREDDLLILDWEKGDDWKKICDFLGEPIPNIPFPHINRGKFKVYQKIINKFFHYLK